MAKKDKGKKKAAAAGARVEVPVEAMPVDQGTHAFRKPSKFR
jgi:hypothetical protein